MIYVFVWGDRGGWEACSGQPHFFTLRIFLNEIKDCRLSSIRISFYFWLWKSGPLSDLERRHKLTELNPFMPTGAFNICCPRDCVSRHNGGTSGAPLKPLRVDSALRALSSLRGLMGAPEVPPLCRETQSLGQQMLKYIFILYPYGTFECKYETSENIFRGPFLTHRQAQYHCIGQEFSAKLFLNQLGYVFLCLKYILNTYVDRYIYTHTLLFKRFS